MGLNISKESTLRLSTITGAVLADAGLILILLDKTLTAFCLSSWQPFS